MRVSPETPTTGAPWGCPSPLILMDFWNSWWEEPHGARILSVIPTFEIAKCTHHLQRCPSPILTTLCTVAGFTNFFLSSVLFMGYGSKRPRSRGSVYQPSSCLIGSNMGESDRLCLQVSLKLLLCSPLTVLSTIFRFGALQGSDQGLSLRPGPNHGARMK